MNEEILCKPREKILIAEMNDSFVSVTAKEIKSLRWNFRNAVRHAYRWKFREIEKNKNGLASRALR